MTGSQERLKQRVRPARTTGKAHNAWSVGISRRMHDCRTGAPGPDGTTHPRTGSA